MIKQTSETDMQRKMPANHGYKRLYLMRYQVCKKKSGNKEKKSPRSIIESETRLALALCQCCSTQGNKYIFLVYPHEMRSY